MRCILHYWITIIIFLCLFFLPSILARGVTPSLLAAVAVISTRAQAPSFSVLALAAVTVPTETNYFYIINNYKMCASVLVNILKCCCSTLFLNIPYNHQQHLSFCSININIGKFKISLRNRFKWKHTLSYMVQSFSVNTAFRTAIFCAGIFTVVFLYTCTSIHATCKMSH